MESVAIPRSTCFIRPRDVVTPFSSTKVALSTRYAAMPATSQAYANTRFTQSPNNTFLVDPSDNVSDGYLARDAAGLVGLVFGSLRVVCDAALRHAGIISAPHWWSL